MSDLQYALIASQTGTGGATLTFDPSFLSTFSGDGSKNAIPQPTHINTANTISLFCQPWYYYHPEYLQVFESTDPPCIRLALIPKLIAPPRAGPEKLSVMIDNRYKSST